MTQIETENYIHNLESQNQQLLALLTQLTVEMKPSRNQSKPNKLFCNYMIEWLERHSINIQENTYQEYKKNLDKYIYPYFKDQGIYLENLTSIDIENYYAYELKIGLSPNTVLKHHANMYSALKEAVVHDIISINPMEKVKRPKAIPFVSNFYSIEQMIILFETIKGLKIYTAVLLAGILGLRRSEIVGLKWGSINFTNGTIIIRDKAIALKTMPNDKVISKLKTNSSYRSLTIPTELLKYLRQLKEQQKNNAIRKLDYNLEYQDYVCVDENGYRLKLNYITETFYKTIRKKELDIIRFHDLRHSCATMLLYFGYSIKQIQAWLGHSDIKTTMKYTHIFSQDNNSIAQRINQAINIDL